MHDCHVYRELIWLSLPGKREPDHNRAQVVVLQYFTLLGKQGHRKQSPDGQAQFYVGGEAFNNSRAKHATKNWTLVFSVVKRHSHCTSASNWDYEAWKFSHTERKSYACTLRFVPAKFYYSNSRPHKCRTHNYVSTSAENGPAMAGPAGPVLVPMVRPGNRAR